MKRIVTFCCGVIVAVLSSLVSSAQSADDVANVLASHQSDLSTEGRAFLINEGRSASFFLLGGLHGDKETPALVTSLWSALQPIGYRFVDVEMSPWTAAHLPRGADAAPLRGGDIEEIQPQMLIRDLAVANPQKSAIRSMVDSTKDGYKRSLAPDLLGFLMGAGDLNDPMVGGVSERTLLLDTLQVESARLTDPLASSVHREAIMKSLFLTHYRAEQARTGGKPRAMVVFGQNHLHRGIDQRGVSTLGNFIAEFATAEGGQSFHLALFAAGGKMSLGRLQDADQRSDEPVFALLASVARYPATVFDLRAVRAVLHAIPAGKLSARDANVMYWADSYDAIVCYREVTPATPPQLGH